MTLFSLIVSFRDVLLWLNILFLFLFVQLLWKFPLLSTIFCSFPGGLLILIAYLHFLLLWFFCIFYILFFVIIFFDLCSSVGVSKSRLIDIELWSECILLFSLVATFFSSLCNPYCFSSSIFISEIVWHLLYLPEHNQL